MNLVFQFQDHGVDCAQKIFVTGPRLPQQPLVWNGNLRRQNFVAIVCDPKKVRVPGREDRLPRIDVHDVTQRVQLPALEYRLDARIRLRQRLMIRK